MPAKKTPQAEPVDNQVEPEQEDATAPAPSKTTKKSAVKTATMEVIVLITVQVSPSTEPLKPGKQMLDKALAESLIEDGFAESLSE